MSAVGCPAWGSLSLFLMESMVGEEWSSCRDGSNLLGLPGPCPWDDDDEPLGLGGIKPKSSPIPRRRSSASSCSDDDSQPPPSSSRRVSFADAFGLSLVSVKQFDSWDVCGPSDPLESDLNETKEYFLSQFFTLPATPEELIQKVQEQKLELESLELLPGTTTLKGIIRVLNLCFDKLVFIRTSLDCWSSHFDLLAEFVPGSSDGVTDCFSFRLTLVPPFGEQGARVDFCLRYETPFGTFWTNNSGQNYVLFCHEKAKEAGENEKKHKRKSCLKSTSQDYSSETSSTSSTEEIPEIILNCEVAAITETVAVKEEKMQKEPIQLQEENIRNQSRRSRRKAARQEKIRQYFAKREEEDHQQIEKNTDEAAVMANVGKADPQRVEAPLIFSTPQTNVWTEMLSSSPAEPENIKRQKCASGSVDAENKQGPATQIQTQDKENIAVTPSEPTASISQSGLSPVDSVNCHKSTISSVSHALANSQNKETLTGQAVSVTQELLECQNFETSMSNSVEKAWECFEKDAMERIGSTVDRRMGEDATISNINPDIRPREQNFTFETIVAPLYHQVFQIMETEKRDLMNRGHNIERSAGKLEDGCQREVTYQSNPRAQSVETRPNACISETHVVSDVYYGVGKEPSPPDSVNTNKTTVKSLSGTNVNPECVENRATFHETPLTGIMDDSLETNMSPAQTHHSTNSLSFQLECLNRTCSMEDIPDKKEQPQDGKRFLQSQYLTHSTLEDTHYKIQHDTCSQSGSSPENSQHEYVPVNYMVLTTQSDLDSISAKISPSIVSEKQSHTDSTEINTVQSMKTEMQQPQASMKSTFTEMRPSSKCMEESHRPIPDASSVCSQISSNVTPNFSQSEVPTPSQNLTPIQIQSPDLDCFKRGQKTAGITPVQFQVTEVENLTQSSDNVYHADGDSHLSEIDSNSTRNNEADGLERIDVNPEDRTLDRTLLNPLHVGRTNQNKEFRDSNFNFPDGSKGPLDNSVSAEKEADIYEEDKWVENPHVNKKQESTDNKHQSVQVSEETKERKELEEVREKEEEDQQQQHGLEGQRQEEVNKEEEEEEDEDKDEEEEEEEEEEEQQQQRVQEEQGQEVQEQKEVNKEKERDQTQEQEEWEQEEQQDKLEEENQEELQKELKQEQDHKQEQEQQQQQQQKLEKEELEKEQQKQKLEEAEGELEEEEQQQKQKLEEVEEELEKEEEDEQQEENEDPFEDELLYIDDDEEETEEAVRENDTEQYTDGWENEVDRLSLEVEIEKQESPVAAVESTTNVDSFKSELCLHMSQEQQSPARTSEHRCSISGEAEMICETGMSQQALPGHSDTTLSDRAAFIERRPKEKQQAAEDTIAEINKLSENPEDISEQGVKDMDDRASTESLTDDEMELYLHRLKNTQQPGFKDSASNGNYSKRPSVSRIRTLPSPMPSISESVDEDQPNASLEDLELEKATLSLEQEEEEVIGHNVLWWREFFASDSLSKMMTYTFLLIVFLVTAYFYDFLACFGLYLLALYWLFFGGEPEPLKVTQLNEMKEK